MRSPAEVKEVRRLVGRGLNDCEIARATGIPRSTVRLWRATDRCPSRSGRSTCPGCDNTQHLPDTAIYAYLLGLYLGDGYIVRSGRVTRFSLYLDARYSQIIASARSAIQSVRPQNRVRVVPRQGCVEICAYSLHWPCLFPQHGPGRKHERPIELVGWQRTIVEDHPEELLRGLIHSDGSRSMNTVAGRGKTYSYPRYMFTNVSDDIRGIFCDACDALGVEWRRMNAKNISVARRASVARLDEFIGPKR